MLSSPPILMDDDSPPLFAPLERPLGASSPERRPSAMPTQDASSDDSINTVSSSTTAASHESAATDVSELARSLGKAHIAVDASPGLYDDMRHPEAPGPASSMYTLDQQGNSMPTASSQADATTVPPFSVDAAVQDTNHSDWRRRTLPALVTDSERALRNIRTSAPSAILGSTSLATSAALEHRATRISQQHQHDPLAAAAATVLTSPTSSPIAATHTSRSASSSFGSADFATGPAQLLSSSMGKLPSPAVARPGSSGSGNFSSTTSGSSSTRPWVRDSDSSSVCSAASSGWSSVRGGGGGDGISAGDQEEPEVYKPVDEGLEFLDPRPEPQGAHLSIHRDDPRHILIKVMLPGFSIENITVAMRRERKVHIVADSYGENGGHFEKLVSLGTEVSSAAPRAEFDGSELCVFIRRKSLPSSSQIRSPPMSPPMSVGSPTSSLSSSAASPRLDNYFDPLVDEAPVVTRSTAESDPASWTSPFSMFRGRNGKSLTGPEGAKAAAKAAREEAARRAKEAAKSLPSCGSCKFPFKRGSVSSSSSVGGGVEESSTATKPLAIPERSGTIKARTPSPTSMPDATIVSGSDGDASSMPPSRPKFRSNNLTLKATDRNSFLDTVLRSNQPLDPLTAQTTLDSWPSPGSQEGSTPRVERTQLDFSTSA
ncbi:hypothetical protein OIV83_003875 [Microbotryomycetes sp. JL201]|nr:hypothetical protein OIV83_003875 [Microbotryomycetes sp. JL201]